MSILDIKEGSICTIIPTTGTMGGENLESLLEAFVRDESQFKFKDYSNFSFKKGTQYKVILTKIRFFNLSHLLIPFIANLDKINNIEVQPKLWVEVFLIEENIKTNIYMSKFTEWLQEVHI